MRDSQGEDVCVLAHRHVCARQRVQSALSAVLVQISDRHIFVTKVIKIPPKAAWHASVGVGNLAHICLCVGEYVSLPPNLYSSPHLLPPNTPLQFFSSVLSFIRQDITVWSGVKMTCCCLTVQRA